MHVLLHNISDLRNNLLLVFFRLQFRADLITHHNPQQSDGKHGAVHHHEWRADSGAGQQWTDPATGNL